MKILWMMVGLPRSGKSTHAKKFGFPVVSCDAIRQSLGCYPFVPAMEPWVWRIAHTMVESLFNAGHTAVVLDSCGHTKARRDEWKSKQYLRRFVTVNTPMEVCVERAVSTDQEYLIPVIERMAKEFEPCSEEEITGWIS